MAVFVQDTFTDTAGVTLASHTGELGATWAKGSPAPNNAVITSAGRVRMGGATSGYYYASGTPASAEYDVECDLYVASKSGQHGIAGRLSTSADTCYRARLDASNNLMLFEKVVAGTNTQLSSTAKTYTIGNTYAIKLEIRDAAKKVFQDGVEVTSSADNAITSAGTAGIRFGSITGASDSNGVHHDNFVATDLSGGGGGAEERTPFGIFVPKTFCKPIRHMGV